MLAFTCNSGEVGWGSKCNHLVPKHAHKQRTIVCADKAAFCLNVFADKTLVWFSWLAWLSDSMPKLLSVLSVSSVFWWFWRWNRWNNLPHSSDFITPVRRVTPLCNFHMEKTHPTKAGYPDRLCNPPCWGTPPNMRTRSRKKEGLYG